MTRASSVVVLALALGVGCTRTTELVAAQSAAACVAPGPPIHLGGVSDAACAGVISSQAARYALCACTDLVLSSGLIVNDLDASSIHGGSSEDTGATTSPWPGLGPVNGVLPKTFFAAVGTDRALQVPGHWEIPGTFVAAGTGDVQLGTVGHVLGNAHIGGALSAATPYWISGDASVAGDISGPLVVGGTLNASPASTVADTVQAGAVTREAVAVAPPCGCDAGSAFDVTAAVLERRTTNSNAFLPFSNVLLEDVETPQSLDLPCGEYYLDTFNTATGGELELRVHGHVGIFVAGDVRLGDNLTVTLDAGSTLDLVVAGSFYINAPGRVFGSPTSPASTRLWVGAATVSLPDTIQFAAFVYAPAAVFSAGPRLSLSGSLFVGTLHVDGDVRIGYDPALTQAGAECSVAAPAAVE